MSSATTGPTSDTYSITDSIGRSSIASKIREWYEDMSKANSDIIYIKATLTGQAKSMNVLFSAMSKDKAFDHDRQDLQEAWDQYDHNVRLFIDEAEEMTEMHPDDEKEELKVLKAEMDTKLGVYEKSFHAIQALIKAMLESLDESKTTAGVRDACQAVRDSFEVDDEAFASAWSIQGSNGSASNNLFRSYGGSATTLEGYLAASELSTSESDKSRTRPGSLQTRSDSPASFRALSARANGGGILSGRRLSGDSVETLVNPSSALESGLFSDSESA